MVAGRVALLLAGACVIGCGQQHDEPADFAVAADDLAAPAPDMARSLPDLAGVDQSLPIQCGYSPDMFPSSRDVSHFCDGTTIAGTCVQTFFAKIAACMLPAGCCVHYGGTRPRQAWASGTYIEAYGFSPSIDYAGFQNGVLCGASNSYASDSQHWSAWDGSTLTIAPNGDATCADGTVVHLGSKWGGSQLGDCDELVAALFGPRGQQCESLLPPPNPPPTCCTPYPADWL